jgi:3'(2'), 5'-bisphosphate nucleotidase
MNYFSVDQAQQIRQLVLDCGKQARSLSHSDFQVFEKGVNDYVTEVDRALDKQLFHGLSRLFPSDGIVTEENAKSRQRFHGKQSRLWFVDPIDGTDDFIHGRPYYSVMLGLMIDYQPLCGWIYAPVMDALYYGGQDWGLFQVRGDRLPERLTPVAPPSIHGRDCPVMIGYKDQRAFGGAIAQALPNIRFRSLGSFGLKVMEVIYGRAGLYVYFNRRVKLWDTVGPIALAKAAGLVCCDLEGTPLQFEPHAIDGDTLAHEQMILIGWPEYLHAFRPKMREIVMALGH